MRKLMRSLAIVRPSSFIGHFHKHSNQYKNAVLYSLMVGAVSVVALAQSASTANPFARVVEAQDTIGLIAGVSGTVIGGLATLISAGRIGWKFWHGQDTWVKDLIYGIPGFVMGVIAATATFV